MNRNNEFSRISVAAHASERDADLKVCHELERLSDDDVVLSARLKNEGARALHVESVEFRLDLSELNLGKARVLASDGKMGGKFSRFDLSSTPFEIEGEQCLVFRKDESDYWLAGFLTWRIFQGVILFRDPDLRIKFHGDFKLIKPGEEIEVEKIALMRRPHWQKLLSDYARAMGRENKAKLKNVNWKGWGSWDYYADNFGEKQILENLGVLKREGLECNLVQLDAGYSIHDGDYLDLKADQFPHGMPSLVQHVAKEGCATGIWIAPFLAHAKSRLAAEHPDWFLQTGAGPLTMEPYPYFVLDYSREDVCSWFRHVLSTMKNSWGITYFKLDFLLMGIKPCAGAVEGLTPLERFHRCLGIVRETLGENDYVLACTAPFGPCVGYAHGMRTGSDIFPDYGAVKRCSALNLSGSYLHGNVFNCDSDYLILRSAENEDGERCAAPGKAGSLALTEARMWADFVSLFGNAAIASDKLTLLDGPKKEILKQAIRDGSSEVCVPLDLWDGDGVTIPGCILAQRSAETWLALFNWGDQPIDLRLKGFVAGEMLTSRRGDKVIEPDGGIFTCTLGPRSSEVFTISGERAFEELRYRLVPIKETQVIEFPSILGKPFEPEGNPVKIDLGEAAQLPLAIDRRSGRGMQNGRFAGVTEEAALLGIRQMIGDARQAKVIMIRSDDRNRTVKIEVGRRLKRLYILHGCEIPVKGKLNSYVMRYPNHNEQLDLIVGTHIGNTHAHYIQPWRSEVARVAWHNPKTEACLFVMEWKSPCPDEVLREIEVTPLEQAGNLYMVGITGYE